MFQLLYTIDSQYTALQLLYTINNQELHTTIKEEAADNKSSLVFTILINHSMKNPKSLSTKEILAGIATIFVFSIGCYVGSCYSYKTVVIPFKQEALQKGYAEWLVVDQVTGRTEFMWKTPTQLVANTPSSVIPPAR